MREMLRKFQKKRDSLELSLLPGLVLTKRKPRKMSLSLLK